MLSLSEGAISPWAEKNTKYFGGVLRRVCDRFGIDRDTSWSRLSITAQDTILFGDEDSDYRGVVFDMQQRLAKAHEIEWAMRYADSTPCTGCDESGLSTAAASAELRGLTMANIGATPLQWFSEEILGQLVEATTQRKQLAAQIQRDINQGDVRVAANQEDLAYLRIDSLISERSQAELDALAAINTGLVDSRYP